jgi:proteasome regulatory subunit
MFEMAREKSPSIVFIDELDSIGARRLEASTSGDREVYRTLMQLLSEIDGFDPREDVRIIGATNRPDTLDPALLRPGRFDRLIYFPLPDEETKLAIFKIHTRRMNLGKNVDLASLARTIRQATGADIKAICTEAGMFAIRDGRDYVEQVDFERAVMKVLPTSRLMEVPEFESKPEKMYGY